MDDVVFQHGTTEQINELAALLTGLSEELNGYQTELEPIKDELKGIGETKSAAYNEYLAIVAKIADREAELTRQRNEANNRIRQMRDKVASAERQLINAQRVERLRVQQEQIDKQLEDVLQTAKWFSQILTHQFVAAKRITSYRRMILADAPGLGKTLTALATCDLIKEATSNARPDHPFGYDPENHVMGVPHQSGRKILYVCPAPLLRNVIREIQLWTDRPYVLLGNQPKRLRTILIQTMNSQDEFVAVVNYEAWRRDSAFLADLKELQFDVVILDEAHTLKDRKTGAYKTIQSLLNHRPPTRISTEEFLSDKDKGRAYHWDKPSNTYVPFVICMTGTPILNKPQDLFSLLSLVDPDHFWNENYFLRDYCEQDYYTKKWGFRSGGLDSLAKRITNIYLRRTKRDAGIILPGKHEEIHELELDAESYPQQALARKQMKTFGMIQLSAEKRLTAAAEIAIITRLRQIETWPAGIEIKDENGIVQLKLDIEESQKIDYLIHSVSSDEYSGLLADLCEGGLREGSSVVVFSQFKAPLRELQQRCTSAGISAVVLDGDTPAALRDEIIRDFDRRYTTDDQARWQVVLANYRVGGVGVTLTRATELIMLDSEWSGGREEQATDRVHRIGQTESVSIHKILIKGSIDSWLEGIVDAKKEMVGGFNDKMVAEADLKKFLED